MNLVPDTKAIIYLFAEGAGKLKTKFSDLHIYFIICCYFIRLFKSFIILCKVENRITFKLRSSFEM